MRPPGRVVALVAGLAALGLLAAAPASARDLTIAVQPDPVPQAVLQRVYVGPFTDATGIAARLQSWSGGLDALRGKGSAEDGWDVVQIGPADLQPACDQGLLEKLHFAAIGGRDHYLPQGTGDCGVGAFLTATVLSWDRDKFPGAPSWADFWDIAKYPGKRGLRRGPNGSLEFALLADGVAPADVYSTLRTADGVDRAFRKLDQLKPYLVWWEKEADAIRILGSGEVLMTSAPSVLVAAADRDEHRNFGMQWAGGLDSVESWAIIKGSPNIAQAEKFLGFVGDPARQATLLQAAAVGGLARGAGDKLAPELASVAPNTPANLATALQSDAGFWRDNGGKLTQRFEDWLKH